MTSHHDFIQQMEANPDTNGIAKVGGNFRTAAVSCALQKEVP